MKIWLISIIEDNRVKTFILIANNKDEALDCLQRQHPHHCPLTHTIVEDLGTARPVDAKLIYEN